MRRIATNVHRIRLVKDGGEQYIFRYRPNRLTELLRTFGRFAANKELSFTWYDAAVLSEKARAASKAAGGGDNETDSHD